MSDNRISHDQLHRIGVCDCGLTHSDTGEIAKPMGYAEIHRKLTHAVTEYDRKQSKRKGYNIYALPQYLGRVQEVVADLSHGADIREAVLAGFTGRLLDVCLKALNLDKSTDAEQRGGYVYRPVK